MPTGHPVPSSDQTGLPALSVYLHEGAKVSESVVTVNRWFLTFYTSVDSFGSAIKQS